ncbi:MAG: alginate export family protein [Nitrospiria bacterium]
MNFPSEVGEPVVFMIDPEASPPLRHEVTPRFSWGTKLNLEFRLRDNRDLRSNKDDLDTRTRGSLTIAGLYLSAPRVLEPRFEFFGELRIERFVIQKEGKKRSNHETDADFRKGYLLWRHFLHPSLQLKVGRQKFRDFREWIYDENLDAIRIIYEDDPLELHLSYSTNLFDPDKPKDKIKNVILHGIYKVWKKDKAAAYIIDRRGRRDDDDPPFHLTHVGVSWKGKSLKRQQYWLEAATVSGDEAGKDVRAYGFDVGWTARFKHPLKPALTFAYAFGSGDANPDDQRDRSFRQTGLQDNSAKLRGVIRIEQYGELFEPELSNLMIGTFGIGFRPMKKGSLDIVFHHYHQVWSLQERKNPLRDAGIKADPNGESRNLGNEVDLIFGWKVTKDFRLEAIAAVFRPGRAFSHKSAAFLGKIKIRLLL